MGGLGLVADGVGANQAGLLVNPQHLADFGRSMAENAHERPDVLPQQPQHEGLGERDVGPRRQGAGAESLFESAGQSDGLRGLDAGRPIVGKRLVPWTGASVG